MGKLYPGCHTQDLNYRYSDSDSLPSGSDFVVWGNRQFYQARGYAEISKSKVTSAPVYLSTSGANDEKQLMKLPNGAMPYAMRMVLPDDGNNSDTLEPSGGQDTLYVNYGGTTNLSTNTFPPRLASGADLIYDANSVALSASTAHFANPQTAISGGEKTVNLHTVGANGIQLNPNSKSSTVKVGVEIEYCLPYSATNVEYDRIVFF